MGKKNITLSGNIFINRSVEYQTQGEESYTCVTKYLRTVANIYSIQKFGLIFSAFPMNISLDSVILFGALVL